METGEDIIKKENPALVVFFIYTPDIKCASICEDMYVKFIILLYDTFLSRPGVEKEQTMITEKTLIEKSYGYLVPSFFYKEYSNCYDQKKLLSYNLPLVIEREQVVDAFNCTADGYDFLYLGQIQQFRNLEKIKVLFNQMNLKLHVFTSQDLESDSIFQIHSAVSGMDMYKLVAHSKFLVAFDNSFPYAHYLPSKSYLYVSFTKPVIAFGDNDESALKDFFSDYRLFFYQNINKPLDKLIEFINNNTETSFDEQIYNQYVQFTPSVSSYNIVEKFFELSGL
ncbi:MAG: hypothetical protein IIY81_06315 [Lachnospiraceae bacterium]|nr:hypothetical protein [Lachnospiraceae bacterium]